MITCESLMDNVKDNKIKDDNVKTISITFYFTSFIS
jgi:hypothetical protein